MKYWLIVLVFIAALIVPTPVEAHRPEDGEEEGITTIPDPDTSFAYYRELEKSREVHIYRVQMDAGQFFHAGINIPQIDRLEDFGVSMALIGPGIQKFDFDVRLNPADDAHEHSEVVEAGHSHEDEITFAALFPSINLEENGYGAMIREDKPSEDFFEPFTQTRYWGRQTLDLTVTESGDYYLVVWNPEGETGKYVMDTGRAEVFVPGDFFRFPVWWVETRLFFEQGAYLLAAAGAILLILAGSAAFLLRRRKRTLQADS